MSDHGWVVLLRKIQDHWIWQDSKYFQWWVTILLNVNHAPTPFPVNSKIHTCQPGESYRSIESWAGLFRSSKRTALKFLELLESDGMIKREILGKGNRRKHLLSVVNWEKYQNKEPENKPESIPERNPKVYRKSTSNNNENNENNENNKKTIGIPFEKFWNLYNKKVGDKAKCERKWESLSENEREKIMLVLPDWLSQFTDKQFQPYPATFLNQKRWQDELGPKPNHHDKHNAKPPEPQTNLGEYDPYAGVKEALGAEQN